LVYVSDVVEAIMLSTFQSSKEIFNVSTQKGVSLTELISTIENVTGVKLIKNFIPENRNDIELKRVGSTKKLESIGWTCKVDLEEGIKKTWSWINTLP
jgi:nucleoside-diphosphate-sugar epimerase